MTYAAVFAPTFEAIEVGHGPFLYSGAFRLSFGAYNDVPHQDCDDTREVVVATRVVVGYTQCKYVIHRVTIDATHADFFG